MNRIYSLLICGIMGLLIATGAARAVEPMFTAGVKLWYAEPKVADRALMYGVAGEMDILDNFWLSGHYLRGEFDFIRRIEPRSVKRISGQDLEVLAGWSVRIFDLGLGFRLTTVLMEDDPVNDLVRIRNPDAYGPVASLGASQSFQDWPWGFTGSPWGWYAGVSLMPADFSDHDGEHVVLMAGFSHYSHNLLKTIGYRYQNFFDHEQVEGFAAALRFEF